MKKKRVSFTIDTTKKANKKELKMIIEMMLSLKEDYEKKQKEEEKKFREAVKRGERPKNYKSYLQDIINIQTHLQIPLLLLYEADKEKKKTSKVKTTEYQKRFFKNKDKKEYWREKKRKQRAKR